MSEHKFKEAHRLRMMYNLKFRHIKSPLIRENHIRREIELYYAKQAKDKRNSLTDPRLDG